MTIEEKDAILKLIKRQVVPAIGCTEPMAVALCVSKATQLLGSRPEHIELRLSANILKNAMGVGIPGTGMIGLPIAIALGALVGRPELGLEVLRDCTCESVVEGRQYIAENRIHIVLEDEDPDKLFIDVVCKAGDHEAGARIKGSHTNFVMLTKDGSVVDESGEKKTESEGNGAMSVANEGKECPLHQSTASASHSAEPLPMLPRNPSWH